MTQPPYYLYSFSQIMEHSLACALEEDTTGRIPAKNIVAMIIRTPEGEEHKVTHMAASKAALTDFTKRYADVVEYNLDLTRPIAHTGKKVTYRAFLAEQGISIDAAAEVARGKLTLEEAVGSPREMSLETRLAISELTQMINKR